MVPVKVITARWSGGVVNNRGATEILPRCTRPSRTPYQAHREKNTPARDASEKFVPWRRVARGRVSSKTAARGQFSPGDRYLCVLAKLGTVQSARLILDQPFMTWVPVGVANRVRTFSGAQGWPIRGHGPLYKGLLGTTLVSLACWSSQKGTPEVNVNDLPWTDCRE